MAKEKTQEMTTYKKQELSGEEHTRPGYSYMPDVDIYETPDSLWLRADMPGVEEDALEVHVANGVLSIDGRVSVKDHENLTPLYTEYNISNYARRFTLTDAIDTARVSARMKNGVLEVELPKTEQAKRRRISVMTS
jgi:HSP20 family molecular chaperone IbpA